MKTIAAKTRGGKPPAAVAPPESRGAMVRRYLKSIASLRLTVVLLGLSMALVFFGTIAQVDESIHTVLNKYFYTWICWVPFQIFVRLFEKFELIERGRSFSGSFPFPGGWILGTLLMVNLLAAHATRFKLTWKRTGIWLIHLGVLLLLLGEFLSSQLKTESRMIIQEGQSANFAEDDRAAELGITDTSDPKDNIIASVPDTMLQHGGRISDPSLPVDVEIVRFFRNSELGDVGANNPATTGIGLRVGASDKKETTGVNPSQRLEMPAAYVRFFDKSSGKDLGTYLVARRPKSTFPIQSLKVGDKTYAIEMRGQRRYFPYSLHLVKFSFDRFVGTSTARNYSSDVRLVDPEKNEDRELRISMNAPLRHRGVTFYQSSFDSATEKATELQVVHNPVWTTPYWACGLVSIGMLVHFGIHLSRFLERRGAK